jgi:hypothetical protein
VAEIPEDVREFIRECERRGYSPRLVAVEKRGKWPNEIYDVWVREGGGWKYAGEWPAEEVHRESNAIVCGRLTCILFVRGMDLAWSRESRVATEPWGVYECEVELPSPFCDKVAEVEGKLISAAEVLAEQRGEVEGVEFGCLADFERFNGRIEEEVKRRVGFTDFSVWLSLHGVGATPYSLEPRGIGYGEHYEERKHAYEKWRVGVHVHSSIYLRSHGTEREIGLEELRKRFAESGVYEEVRGAYAALLEILEKSLREYAKLVPLTYLFSQLFPSERRILKRQVGQLKVRCYTPCRSGSVQVVNFWAKPFDDLLANSEYVPGEEEKAEFFEYDVSIEEGVPRVDVGRGLVPFTVAEARARFDHEGVKGGLSVYVFSEYVPIEGLHKLVGAVPSLEEWVANVRRADKTYGDRLMQLVSLIQR